MKCKHCGQPIENLIDKDVKRRAIKLFARGDLSLREISKRLDYKISPSSVLRIAKEWIRLSIDKETSK